MDPRLRGGTWSWGGASRRRLQRAGASEEDAAAVDLHRHGWRAALVLAERLARRQADPPIVQRAGDRTAMDDALTQPPMLVRAAVEKSKNLALGGAEHRDIVAALDLYRAAAAHRDLVDQPDVEPFYGHAHSSCGGKGASGAGCSDPAP